MIDNFHVMNTPQGTLYEISENIQDKSQTPFWLNNRDKLNEIIHVLICVRQTDLYGPHDKRNSCNQKLSTSSAAN